MARLSAKAILFGVLADFGASLGAGLIGGFLATVFTGSAPDPSRGFSPWTALTMALGMAASLLGGFVAGKTAGRAYILNGAITGAVSVGLSYLIFPSARAESGLPLWVVAFADACVIPVAVLGSLLAKWGSSAPDSIPGQTSALPPPMEPGFSPSSTSSAVSEPTPMFSSKAEPRGLGGWLILPMLGLFGTVIRVGFSLATDYFPIFADDTWSALTSADNEAYHPLWGPLLVFEIAGNLALAAASVVALVLFFRQSPAFPKLMIGILVGGLLFLLIDLFGGRAIPAIAEQPTDPDSIRDLTRAAIGCMIWVPYLLRSRRVRNTFVRPADASPPPAIPQPIG